MSRRVSESELAARESAVQAAMADDEWHRPIDIAQRSGLSLNTTLATLKRMEATGDVARRSYQVKTMRGRYRRRIVDKPIVEYQQRRRATWETFPAFLICPRPVSRYPARV